VPGRDAPAPDHLRSLIGAARDGDRGSVARLISLVERGGADATAAVAALHPHTGGASTIGITGAPGSGKSTLTSRLVARLRQEGHEVGVLAVDPTSPFTGGAILGDRIRMQDHAVDAGVFIRSMATRGHLGGLALATPQAVRVLDAAGKPWVILETVGVGQVEIAIASEADMTIVVVTPGWGDGVQAAKAGLLEIADVLVVNKADRPGVADTVHDLAGMLDLAGGGQAWRPPVVETVASEGRGIDELWDTVLAHHAFLRSDGLLETRRRARLRAELRAILLARLQVDLDERLDGERFEQVIERVASRELDPYAAADELVAVR